MGSRNDKEFDLIIADPPYGINAPNMTMGSNPNRKGENQYPGTSTATKLKRLNGGSGKLKNRILNTSEIDWDNEKPDKEYFDLLFRISVDQIIWGGNYFTDNLQESRCWVCWDKLQPWDNFSQFELAWTSFDMPAKMFKYSNTGGANAEKKIHPTQKPVLLYDYLFTTFAKENYKVLDPNGGSMSIAISALKANALNEMNIDLTIIENNQSYFEAGIKRIQNHENQLTIFN